MCGAITPLPEFVSGDVFMAWYLVKHRDNIVCYF
jgi:hypothetical protein